MAEAGRLRRSLGRWSAGTAQEEQELREAHARHTEQAIGDAPDREPVTLRGTLRTVTVRPRGGVPAVEAELADGSGVVTLVWLGRRRIVGIDPGVSIRVTGRIGVYDDVRVLYNPRYELIAGAPA